MSTKKIQSGDIVRLLSGGPKMTVTSTELINRQEHVFCLWFDANLQTQSQGFLPQFLVKIAPEEL